jgi:hypothetical protein
LQIITAVNAYSQSSDLNKDKITFTKSKIYYFSGTTDSLFCNTDSIVGSDCLGGELYLSKQGNAIYIFHCCCDGQDVYNIGKYTMTQEGISCKFTNECNYKGAFKTIEKWELLLKKINCSEYVYGFEEITEDENSKAIKQKYVVKEESHQSMKEFIKIASKFKKLIPYLN